MLPQIRRWGGDGWRSHYYPCCGDGGIQYRIEVRGWSPPPPRPLEGGCSSHACPHHPRPRDTGSWTRDTCGCSQPRLCCCCLAPCLGFHNIEQENIWRPLVHYWWITTKHFLGGVGQNFLRCIEWFLCVWLALHEHCTEKEQLTAWCRLLLGSQAIIQSLSQSRGSPAQHSPAQPYTAQPSPAQQIPIILFSWV